MSDKECEIKRVWHEWIKGNPNNRKLISIDVIDTDGKEVTLMTKDWVIHKLQRGFPLDA